MILELGQILVVVFFICALGGKGGTQMKLIDHLPNCYLTMGYRTQEFLDEALPSLKYQGRLVGQTLLSIGTHIRI